MDLAPRLNLMNWLVSQGLTGAAGHDLMRGFCERCRTAGLELSRGIAFIDTLHPIFEGRGFRWNDVETNEADVFDYGSSGEGEAAQNWRRSTHYHMLERGLDEMLIDLAESGSLDFAQIRDLWANGHRHFVAFVHRFGEAGTIGEMDGVYSYWTTRKPEGFDEPELAALRDLVPVLGLAIKSAAQVDIARTLGRVYLGRDAAEQVMRGRISRGVTERIKAVLWFSDLRGSTGISESIAPDEIIPFLNDYAPRSRPSICSGAISARSTPGARPKAVPPLRPMSACMSARCFTAISAARTGSISPWWGLRSTRSAASPRCAVRSIASCWHRPIFATDSMRPGAAISSPPAALPCAALAARRISIPSIP
jgi:adenylate cyclase